MRVEVRTYPVIPHVKLLLMEAQNEFANSVIGDFAAQHPRTLKDLSEAEKSSSRDKFFYFVGFPIGWDVGAELTRLMELDQIHDGLPEPPDSFKHMYLACVPHLGWPISFSHWSVFSQGEFYHLSVPGLESGAKFENSARNERPENAVLKIEGAYSEDLSSTQKRPPIAVYEVGSTDYSPHELRLIAEWLIAQMPVYDFFERNCQVSALSLINRAVMTKRDSSVFVGTKRQIAAWAAKNPADLGAHINSRENGFLVQVPGALLNAGSHRIIRSLNLGGFTNNLQQHKQISAAIRVLYKKGPLAPGAQDPTGAMGPWEYAGSKLSSDLKESWQMLSRAIKELGHDISGGNFRSALEGRADTKKEFFLKAKKEMDEGSGFGKAFLYFHATVLYGSMSRAQRMTADDFIDGNVEDVENHESNNDRETGMEVVAKIQDGRAYERLHVRPPDCPQ
ncbi:hypothetical protein VTL71DRAFT_11791 [Oculimacula yallundae]|uniref:DUF4105 domain-containing protein n=1 Tax=Oculimacula yallundae TaxID=86028 RepID=A0ABR4CRQ6_9HELO